MREIKFRILLKNGYYGSNSDHLKFFDFSDVNFIRWLKSSGYTEFPIQQFTGLLDSEGKEIYEGDILEVKGWRGSKGIAEVKWEQQDSSDDAGVNMVGFRRFDEYGAPKIIGHTMQNPELLKQ